MKTAQDIFSLTLIHGGVTVDLEGNVPTSGFMVSEMGGVEVPLDKFCPADIEHVISKNKNALHGIGAYIGTWVDRETNMVYVDYSVNFTELGKAFDFAQKNR